MKKYKQLISQQRYTISAMLQKGYSQKEIADAVGVSASTISRELNRNRGKRGVYSYKLADEMAQERRERVVNNNAKKPAILRRVSQMIEEDYSPAQISGVLRKEGEAISHECIYQYIRRDKANGGTLYKHCRHMLKHRKRYVGTNASCKNIPNRRSISERPIEADNKSNPGHWEMDTIVGKDNKGAIVTLTERTTNFLLMMKLKFGKNATETAKAVVKLLLPYKNLVKTITTDNGSEFACHELITKKIGAKVYFADPYSSWQKGAIEHANKLIRQYIPKGSSFDEFDDEFIKKVQMKINRRPREKLNFEPPVKAFQNVIKKLHL
jgi:IS30 family transposase